MWHFDFTNRYQRDENICYGRLQKTQYICTGSFLRPKMVPGDGVKGPFSDNDMLLYNYSKNDLI